MPKYFSENGIETEGKSYLQALADNISADYEVLFNEQAIHFENLKNNAHAGPELDKIIAQRN